MTVIAARIRNGLVEISADSNGVAGGTTIPRVDSKLIQFGDNIIVGFTSSYRMGQILRHHVTFPPPSSNVGEWLVEGFIPTFRAALAEHGWMKKDSEREEGGVFLIAHPWGIATIEDDFQVGEHRDYYAVGSGRDVALGALHQGATAQQACMAARDHCTTVGGPLISMFVALANPKRSR